MKRDFPWDIAAVLAARAAGLLFVAGVIGYMARCYLAGQYLRDDPALTLIALTTFIAGAVFAVYCTIMDVKKRSRHNSRPPEPDAIIERK